MFIFCPAKLGSFGEIIPAMISGDYLNPLKANFVNELESGSGTRTLFQSTTFFKDKLPDLSQFDLAIVGVQEDRFRPEYAGCAQGPDAIRKELYKLVKPRTDVRLLDLGNISAGERLSDTHFALKNVLSELLREKILTLVLGGSQDLMAAQYAAFQGVNSNVQVLVVDSKMDMQRCDDIMLQNYLPRIIAHEPGYLFNITQAAYQGHFVESETYDAFERMNFDMLRLGSLRGNIQDLEPYCRSTQLLGFSLQAVKASDAPGQTHASPNGLSGEEACQISRYAGMSADLLSAGFYDLNPSFDTNGVSAALVAQMLWYFMEGYSNRRNDYPVAESKDYIIYRTTSRNMEHELVFYKSVLSNRWWMEVPYPHERSKHEGKFLVPCSYKDYQTAQNDEIPDRWMKTYQKL